MNILPAPSSAFTMSRAWTIEGCAREYGKLTGRDAADDGRLPYLEGVYGWRMERLQYDATHQLRTVLKTARPMRGRDEEREAKRYAQYKRAELVFVLHAELHDDYERGRSMLAQIASAPLQLTTADYQKVVDGFESGRKKIPNATDIPVFSFVLGAIARWQWKGWGAPTPLQLAVLAGATGFEEYFRCNATRERWKSRISKYRNRSVPREVLLRAAADAELDGTGCFVLAPAPKVSAIPGVRIELPLDETR